MPCLADALRPSAHQPRLPLADWQVERLPTESRERPLVASPLPELARRAPVQAPLASLAQRTEMPH
eukprot:6884811-Pyramimonas_sp.AAC.1